MDFSSTLDLLWIVISGILVFFMQAGFTLFEAGLTRSKNMANIAMKNFVDLFVGAIAFWGVGYSLMYGDSFKGLVGEVSAFYIEENDMHNLFFQTVFCATAATIISGAIAERAKFMTYVAFSFLFTTFLYPVAGHWVWQAGGWLANLGFVDFSGATVVHVMGGFAALMYAWILGPRYDKYSAEGKVNFIGGHNYMFSVLGVFILWMGWFGFNAGSTLAITGDSSNVVPLVILNTNLSGSMGGICALIITKIKYKKADIAMTLNGTLAGLVGITAGCSIVDPLGAIVMGGVCGILVTLISEVVERKLKIDDAVSAFSVHGISGLIGTILVGVFSTDNGLLYGGGTDQLIVQVIGAFSVALWSVVVTSILVLILKYTVGIRVPLKHEKIGLDNVEHNIHFNTTIERKVDKELVFDKDE